MPTSPMGPRLGLAVGRDLLHRIASKSGLVLFTAVDDRVGRQVKAHAVRAAMPYVIGRWIGGTLTNLATVRRGVERLEKIERWESDGTVNRYAPVERAPLLREKRRLSRRFDGLRGLDRLPAALVTVQPTATSQVIGEARKAGRAVIIALTTRGAPPPDADVVIQTQGDDAANAVGKLADAVIDGKPGEHPRSASERPRRPRDNGPGAAPVPARLRPRPSPKSGHARPPETA